MMLLCNNEKSTTISMNLNYKIIYYTSYLFVYVASSSFVAIVSAVNAIILIKEKTAVNMDFIINVTFTFKWC